MSLVAFINERKDAFLNENLRKYIADVKKLKLDDDDDIDVDWAYVSNNRYKAWDVVKENIHEPWNWNRLCNIEQNIKHPQYVRIHNLYGCDWKLLE